MAKNKLYCMTKGGAELHVEHEQMSAFEAEGWSLRVEKKAPHSSPEPKPRPALVDMWRGNEARRCEPDQVGHMLSLGFKLEKTKEKTDAGQLKDPDSGRSLEGEPSGPSGSSSEVGLAGDPVPSPGAEAGLDDEPPAREITRPSTKEEVLEAFSKLDPDNDAHWTKFGEPRIEYLNSLLVQGSVSRPQLNSITKNARRPAR